ncbi:MAG: hypothetical protein OXC67_06255 [Flavobacteriaceae bacterium]|nr:hypothetical protein [Flavobacteriaceae bacterium]MCY4299155.1 hypothetical protein [Flavobacteriaceae bacterium]
MSWVYGAEETRTDSLEEGYYRQRKFAIIGRMGGIRYQNDFLCRYKHRRTNE